MKNILTLLLLCVGINFGLLAQSSLVYYEGEGMQASVRYSDNLSKIKLIFIAGKRPASDKMVWLRTTIDTKQTSSAGGKTIHEFEVTDENNQRYRVRIYADFSPGTITKFNSSGKATQIWNVNARKGATSTNSTLTFDGDYAVKFDYDKTSKKMSNLKFSTDKKRLTYHNFEVYDIADYEDGGYKGKLFTVKDGEGEKFTILYSDSFDYIVVTPVDHRMEEGTTLYLQK